MGRILGYNDYESVKHISFGLSVLSITDLVVVKAEFNMLIGACMRSDRDVLRVCAERSGSVTDGGTWI